MNWSQSAWEILARHVNRRTGLTFGALAANAEIGMRRAMARAGIDDAARYSALVAIDERLLDDLIAELTIGETYFFREPNQFDFIRRVILPEVRRRQGPAHVLRAWSAACATGEEIYSLAMLFEDAGLGGQASLLASDISLRVLARAQAGVYGAWSLRGEGAEAARSHLLAEGKQFQVPDRLRSRVRFVPLNLASDNYPSRVQGLFDMDLILCRNVLIYFDRDTVGAVARRLFQALAAGGWLIAGAADPPLWDKAPFEVHTEAEGIFYRRPAVSNPDEEKIAPEEAPGQVENLSLVEQVSNLPESLATVAEPRDSTAAVAHVRALANLDPVRAEKECALAAASFPTCTELAYLRAVLFLAQRREVEALQALRRVLYLDQTLAMAHFTLGTILARGGDSAAARRAFRAAHDLCVACDADEPVPYADGETASRMAEAAAAELAALSEPRCEAEAQARQ